MKLTESQILEFRLEQESWVSEREGMIAENTQREFSGFAPAHSDNDFFLNADCFFPGFNTPAIRRKGEVYQVKLKINNRTYRDSIILVLSHLGLRVWVDREKENHYQADYGLLCCF
jgi:hypothetical protein